MVHTAVSAILGVLSALDENITGWRWDLKLGSHCMFIVWYGSMWGLGDKPRRVHCETQ